MSVNKAIILGNVGQDPEIRTSQDGREIASFSLATTESWRDKNTGEKKDKTEWHRVVVFSQGLVGVVKNYVKKGSKLYIEGAIQTRKWTDASGADKYTTEIVLQSFNSVLQMLDSRGQGQSDNSSTPAYASDFKQDNKQSDKFEEIDDEIPF